MDGGKVILRQVPEHLWHYIALLGFGLIPFFWDYAFWFIVCSCFFGIFQNFHQISRTNLIFELKKDIFVIAFLTYFFVNTLVFLLQANSFEIRHLEPWFVGLLMVIFWATVRCIKTEITYHHAALSVAVGLFISAILLLAQRTGFVFDLEARVSGLTTGALVVGLFYGLAAGWCASLLYMNKARYSPPLGVCLLLLAFICATYFTASRTQSLFTFIGLAYFISWYIWRTKKFILIIYAILLLIAAPSVVFLIESYTGGSSLMRVFSALKDIFADGAPQDSSSNHRFVMWSKAIELIKQSPMFGYGTFNERPLIDHNNWYSHNQYLSWLVSGGIVGLLLGLSALFFGYHQFSLGRRKGLNIKIVMLIYFAAPQLTNSDLTSTSVLHHFLAFLSLLKYDFEDPDKPRG